MNPIALASGVMPEFSAARTVEAAGAAGFDAAGIWVEPAEWTAQTTRETKAALSATGLPALDVEVVWFRPDSAMDDHFKVLDVGIELGAANVLCVASGLDAGEIAARLGEMCRRAEGSDIRVALEFGIFSGVPDLATALAVLDRVRHPKQAILIDPIHVDRSGTRIDAIAALDPALLPYAQFCDARAERPDPPNFDAIIIDAIDLREEMGHGALPLDAMYKALPANIPLSIELRSKALRDGYPDPDARAKALAASTRRWLETRA